MERRKEWIKRVFLRKHALLWMLIGALWMFVFIKILMSTWIQQNMSLVSAFSVTNPGLLEATVEVTARFPEEYLDSFDKRQMMRKMAKDIGLELSEEPRLYLAEDRQELSYEKEAKAAATELRIISLSEETESGTEVKHYLYAKITLKESVESVLAYKELLEETLEGLNGTEISTTIQLAGEYSGYLTMERKNEVTERILSALNAKVV